MKTGSADPDGQPSEIKRLSFVSLVELVEGVFRGGMLVTDMQSKPVEFRCTSPIKPNSVQQTLYGETLKRHMCVELTAQPIKNAVKEELDVVFINQTEFWEFREDIDIPLLLVRRQGEEIVGSSDSHDGESEVVTSPSSNFDPITVTCHPDHPGDRDILSVIGNQIDFVEPFSRINTAIELVHQRESKKAKRSTPE